MQDMWAQFLGQEESPDKKITTNSSILAGKSHGQRSLAGYSPWGHKESDTTQQLNNKQQSNITEYDMTNIVGMIFKNKKCAFLFLAKSDLAFEAYL